MVDDFTEVFGKLAKNNNGPFFLNDNEHQRADNPVETGINASEHSLQRYSKRRFLRLAPHLHDLRFKERLWEIDLIKQAVEVTTDTFNEVLTDIKPGVMEYEIEAEWARSFIRKRCKFAYGPIIASGKNACVLHYLQNDQACKKGDLLLMDVGACYANYNADLTRTVPVSGKFSPQTKTGLSGSASGSAKIHLRCYSREGNQTMERRST